MRQFILFQNFWYSLIASSISFNLLWGFRYLQFKASALHRLELETPLKVYGNLRARSFGTIPE